MSSEHRIESFDPRGVFIECATTRARTYIDRDQGGSTGAETCVCGTTVRATWSAAGCGLDILAFGEPKPIGAIAANADPDIQEFSRRLQINLDKRASDPDNIVRSMTAFEETVASFRPDRGSGPDADLERRKNETRSHVADHIGSARATPKDLDLARLHRFLVEHGAEDTHSGTCCTACSRSVTWSGDPSIEELRSSIDHAPDCEWVALVEMTRPAQTPPEEARS